MKQLVVSVLFFAVVLGLAACGGGAAAPEATPAPTLAPAPTSAPTVAAPSGATQAAPTDATPAVSTAPKMTPVVPLDDPNMQKTTSGLKYSDIVAGTGATPASTDWVTVQYTVTLQDGTLIGASSTSNGPENIPLDELAKTIPGWAEGMSTMKVGGVRELVVPPNLAFGDKGSGGAVPPNATLVFVVELLNAKPAPQVKIDDTLVGTGAEATAGMMVKIDYTGTLTNGTVFGSSAGKQPAEFVLGAQQGGPGWDKGLPGMKVGGKRTLTVPPELAYGPQGNGSTIPPNATLIFEIELLDVQPPPQVKIEDIQVGTGAEAVSGKTLTVNYTGTLTNGTVFDSSYGRNQPFTLQLGAGQVIPGWEQGLQGMKVGGKRKLTIPPSLGYGPQGQGTIPPNSTLIFEVELLDVK